MTNGVQRLDPPWRAHKNNLRTTSGGLRGRASLGEWRVACVAGVIISAAFALPSTAYAINGAPPEPVEAKPPPVPAPPQAESVPAAPEKAAAQTHARGMVRYDRPVFHNGHLVLWHGAWRSGSHNSQVFARPGPASSGSAARDFTILADGADSSATRMATEFAQAMQNGESHIKVIAGKTSSAALDKAVKGDAADLAIVPMDAIGDSGAGSADKSADWRMRAPYLARLDNEPITIIAPLAIADIHQLTGRKVSAAAADGATAASAAIVFSRLNIAPTMTNESLTDALPRLARGEIDAVFVVGVGDAKALADFGKDGRFHVLSVPYVTTLQGLYYPMRLTAREEANLISGDDKVDTIGVPMALLAIDAAPDSPRAVRLSALTDRLFGQFDQNLGALAGSRWKDVNLAARIPGWPRFGATQAWLDQKQGTPNPALETFRSAAETATSASEGPGGADSDKLYESLMKLSGAAQ
jgi:hypothetical protein